MKLNAYLPCAALFFISLAVVLSLVSCAPKQSSRETDDIQGPETAQEVAEKQDLGEQVPDKQLGNTPVDKSDSGAYESYPVFKASEILEPELLKGEYHEVVEEVESDCIWNSYKIKSEFGDYEANNTRMLEVRVREINATAQLKKTSGAEALTVGAANTVIDPFRSAVNVASKPVETVKGVPGGVVTFFKKIYYTGEKTVNVAGRTATHAARAVGESDESEDGESGDRFSELTGDVSYLADWYLGISSGERCLARKLGVDPYTSNPELAAELRRVAKYDRIGRLGLGFASVPSVPGVGYVKDVNHYVWDKDPKELREFNRKELINMGIDEELVERFLNSPYYSPSFQTTIVLSLSEMEGVGNREEIIEDAVVASSISEAEYFMNIVFLLVWFHNNETPLDSIINHGDITSGLTEDSRIITIIPADYLCWSGDVADAARFHDEVFKEVPAEGRELWVAGEVSATAKDEIGKVGWEVYENVSVDTGAPAGDGKKEEVVKGINKGALDVFQQDTQNSGVEKSGAGGKKQ